MELLRTPEERFADLPGYPFEPHYLDIPFEAQSIRMHHVDEGPAPGRPAQETVVLLHGEPSWSYLYRKMIPVLVAAGHRVIAPDLIGFGRSDKPAGMGDHTYDRQVRWLRTALFEMLGPSPSAGSRRRSPARARCRGRRWPRTTRPSRRSGTRPGPAPCRS